MSINKTRKYYNNNRKGVAIFFGLLTICLLLIGNGFDFSISSAADPTGSNGRFVPIDQPNQPIGTAQGIFPGRVAWVHNPQAASWDGEADFWWTDEFTKQNHVSKMLTSVVNNVAGLENIVDSWDSLFRALNRKKGKGDIGFNSTEKIAVKVNLNSGGGKNGNRTDTSPQMVYALLEQLVIKVGVPQENITLYDAQRENITAINDHCGETFPSVHYNDWGSWISDKLSFSSDEIDNSDVRRLPQAVVEADYLINMAILKRHSKLVENWSNGAGQTGISVCGKNHFGTCGKPSALHETIRDWNRGMGHYNPIVDLTANKYLGGNTVLYIVDGLYAADFHFAIPKKWKMSPFNNHWPASVFASQDPLAIDSVCLDFLNEEWGLVANADNYLHEAAQANSPPSGTRYVSNGQKVTSLGVHEHWNNATDKKYSGNMGKENGIELIYIKL